MEILIPRGVGARHWADPFSCGLLSAKRCPGIGGLWASEFAGRLAQLIPEGTDCIAVPPPGRRRVQRPFCFPAALAEAVASRLGLPLVQLRWVNENDQGPRGMVCGEDLSGSRVCLVDDFALTMLTAEQAAAALTKAGAVSVYLCVLGVVERSVWRPQAERDLLAVRGGRKRARAVMDEDKGEAGAWREAVFARDDGACRVCGSRENLTAHHAWAQGERPDLRRVVANGVTVCSACHQWAHSPDGKRQAREWRVAALTG